MFKNIIIIFRQLIIFIFPYIFIIVVFSSTIFIPCVRIPSLCNSIIWLELCLGFFFTIFSRIKPYTLLFLLET